MNNKTMKWKSIPLSNLEISIVGMKKIRGRTYFSYCIRKTVPRKKLSLLCPDVNIKNPEEVKKTCTIHAILLRADPEEVLQKLETALSSLYEIYGLLSRLLSCQNNEEKIRLIGEVSTRLSRIEEVLKLVLGQK